MRADAQEKHTVKKTPVEVSCTKCKTRFRLWIPVEYISHWEKGVNISCICCGTVYHVSRSGKSFEARPLKDMLSKVKQSAVETIKETPPVSLSTQPVAPKTPDVAPQAEATQVTQTVASPVEQKATQAVTVAPPPPPPPPAESEPVIEATEEAFAGEPEGQSNYDFTVIFVEDEKLAREMADYAMKDTNIRLVAVKNGNEALDFAKKEKIDLIVTDLYLKNPKDPQSTIDGEDLLFKFEALGKKLPAIVTTGKDIIDDMLLEPKWYDLRVKGFIQKGNPFWAEELKAKIKEVLDA